MKSVYRFSYGNVFNFILNQIITISYHFIVLLLLAVPVLSLYGEIEYKFRNNHFLMKIITIFMFILLFLYLLYLIVILFLPKKAIIDGHFIRIRRYFLNFSYLIRGFNDEIFIKDIIECKKYEGKRYFLDRTGPYAIFFFNWDSLVKIKTNNDKTYLIPLKNSDDFIDEVNKMISR